jgi:hypothetical protein
MLEKVVLNLKMDDQDKEDGMSRSELLLALVGVGRSRKGSEVVGASEEGG